MNKNWIYKKIGEIFETGAGGTPLKSHKEYYHEGTIPWLLSGEVNQRRIESTNNFISPEGYKNSSAKLFPKDTVLIAMYGATAGQVGILDIEASTNQAVCGILPNNRILPDFLYFYLLSIKKDLVAQSVGNAQPNLSQIKIKNTKIPIPPLPEQQRIVDILDQSFAAIDQAIENTSINQENSKEIYEAFIENIFGSFLKNCPRNKLSEICIIRPPKNEAKVKLNESSMVSFAPMEDLGINQKFMIPEKEKKLIDVYSGYTYFAENDVLLAKITPCFENGKLGIAKNLINEIGFGSSEYIVFRTLEELRPEFLYYYLSRENFRNEGIKHMQGAVGHKRVSLEFVSNYLIPVPSLEQQDEIIDKIDTFFDQTNSLNFNYKNKMDLLEELKQSILHKAFNGELT